MHLCEAAFGYLVLREGDQFETVALHGVPTALTEFLCHTLQEPGKHTAVGRMLEGEDFVHYEDMTTKPAYLLDIAKGEEDILESHRREIVVVFCDLRGYTAFTETAEPEDVLDFLGEYHGALGPLVSRFEGTLDQFSGDGIMVLFNDPVPCADPAERAVRMAMAMREAASELIVACRRRLGFELGFGLGIAQGTRPSD
jgi:class 3 adenylate cyclase